MNLHLDLTNVFCVDVDELLTNQTFFKDSDDDVVSDPHRKKMTSSRKHHLKVRLACLLIGTLQSLTLNLIQQDDDISVSQ